MIKNKNIFNTLNTSLKNKKKITNLILPKKNNSLCNFLLKNNLIKQFSKNTVYFSFYKNKPKFKKIISNNEYKYTIK